MVYDIYTYGNGQILEGIFNAIAMCLNSQTGSLFQALKTLGLIVGAFWAALYAIYGDQVKAFTHWIIPMTILLNLLFVPTASVWIHDPVTRFHQKVDHVPYGLAVFSGYASKIGHLMTEQVERIFTLPDDLKYQKTGTLFASNIIIQSRTFHISNADVSENMRGFVGQCIIYDAMLGRKYSLDELRQSDDIWSLVSANASPVRSFLWRDPKNPGEVRARPENITCEEGIAKFNRLWAGEIDRSANLFGKKIFGHNGLISEKAEFLRHLPLAYQTLGNIAKSASDILKQQMMIYAVVDGVESQSTAVGNAPNFAARRAYLQQRATYETLGAMVGETLPTMKAVLEAIAYGCFIFMLPLAVLPFGWQYLLRWAQILLWLQMWAPLYAILNYVMTMAARSKTIAALAMSNEAGVTIASSVGINNMNTDIQAMAGYLAMSIPFLSIAIIKGVGSFVHMSSHLGNISQNAAGAAASEITTGNLSYGNISEGNSQIGNSSMLNHSRGASYKASSFQYQDGRADITTMGDGSQVTSIGTSNLPISINAADSISNQQSEMSSQSFQRGMGQMQSAQENFGTSARSVVDLSETLSQMESTSNSASLGINTEDSKSIQRASQMIEDFSRQNSITTQKAADLFAEVSAGGGSILSGSVSAKGSVSASDQELLQKAEKFSGDHHFQEAMRSASQASKNISHTASSDESRRLAESVSQSYESGVSNRNEASKSFNESESYSKQASYTKSHADSINGNYNQQYFEWLSQQPSENARGPMGAHAAAQMIAHEPHLATAYAEKFINQTMGNISSPTSIGESGHKMKQDYDSDQRHQNYDVDKNVVADFHQEHAPSFSQASEAGTEIRQDVNQNVDRRSEEVMMTGVNLENSGAGIRTDVQNEQGGSVIVRAVNKVIDVENLKHPQRGESQQR